MMNISNIVFNPELFEYVEFFYLFHNKKNISKPEYVLFYNENSDIKHFTIDKKIDQIEGISIYYTN
jgi:hypothetical protein